VEVEGEGKFWIFVIIFLNTKVSNPIKIYEFILPSKKKKSIENFLVKKGMVEIVSSEKITGVLQKSLRLHFFFFSRNLQ
jgi:hypothetical protein